MKPHVVISVIAIMAGLFFIDRFLAALEHREVVNEARSLYARGEQLLSSGHALEAVGTLQRAYSLARQSPQYQLALADALFAGGRLYEAEANLSQLLERDPNEGATNLTMARLQTRLGNNRDAEAYYHRAVYGTWPSVDRAREVRMELADLLAKNGEKKQLLSELLLLQDSAAKSPAMLKQIALLFSDAGSPARAADVYRTILQQDANDADAYVGLADSELAQGDFRSAQGSLRNALRRKPDDSSLSDRLEFVKTLSNLDPTLRHLTSKEKVERSARVLDLVKQDLAECAQNQHQEERVQDLIASADRAEKVKKAPTNELAESALTLTERLWRTRKNTCGEPAANSPLSPLMLKIAQ